MHYLGHVHRLGIKTVNKLAEDHTIPEKEDELPGPSPGAEGLVTWGDDPPLVQPAQALSPHWLHHNCPLMITVCVHSHNVTF